MADRHLLAVQEFGQGPAPVFPVEMGFRGLQCAPWKNQGAEWLASETSLERSLESCRKVMGKSLGRRGRERRWSVVRTSSESRQVGKNQDFEA